MTKERNTKAEYIEREAALALLKDDREVCADSKEELKYIREDIRSIPAADVRPVVLCKDCIYSPSGDDNGENQGFSLEWPHDDWPEDNPCPCKCEDGWYSIKPTPGFYCAYGKRG